MGNFTNLTKNKVLDLVLGRVPFTVPSTWYYGYFTTLPTDAGTDGAEASGGGYLRRGVANTLSNYPTAASRSKTLAADIAFPSITASQGNSPGWGIWDAAAGGNLWFYGSWVDANGAPVSPLAMDVGKTPTIQANKFTIRLKNNISDYLANAVLNLLFGNQPFTPPTSVYFSQMTTAPTATGGGVEVSGGGYADQVVADNTTNFPNAVAGVKQLQSAVTYPVATADQAPSTAPVTHVALYDAADNGNLLLWAPFVSPQIIRQNDQVSYPSGSFTFSTD